MVRMPELRIVLKVVVISMQITYHFAYFLSNWNILAFLRLFDLLCVTLYYFCERFQKEKNFEEKLYLFCLTYANYSFAGNKNVAFDFSDACLFGHPVYFYYQDFLILTLDFSFQLFLDQRKN